MLDGLRERLGALAGRRRSTVAILRLDGVIAAGTSRLRGQGLSLQSLADPIERAFSLRGVAAVALVVNSPGGSPAQSSLIASRIRALAAEKGVPVLAFVEDVAASGGYWLACAADEIYVDPSSIVGSIGVIYAGFGFQDLIARHGVERRIHTAGDHKSTLDPFRPEQSDEVERLRAIQAEIHDAFKVHVRARRGARLKGDEASLFSGEFWSGARAVELGLADAIGEARTILRSRFGKRVRMVVVTPRRSFLRSLLGRSESRWPVSGEASRDLTMGVVAALEERWHWSRFGL